MLLHVNTNFKKKIHYIENVFADTKIKNYDSTYHEIYNNIKKEFYTRTKLWRMKNHKTTVFISADSDEEGEGALSIFEIKFNNWSKPYTYFN